LRLFGKKDISIPPWTMEGWVVWGFLPDKNAIWSYRPPMGYVTEEKEKRVDSCFKHPYNELEILHLILI